MYVCDVSFSRVCGQVTSNRTMRLTRSPLKADAQRDARRSGAGLGRAALSATGHAHIYSPTRTLGTVTTDPDQVTPTVTHTKAYRLSTTPPSRPLLDSTHHARLGARRIASLTARSADWERRAGATGGPTTSDDQPHSSSRRALIWSPEASSEHGLERRQELGLVWDRLRPVAKRPANIYTRQQRGMAHGNIRRTHGKRVKGWRQTIPIVANGNRRDHRFD